MEGYDYRRGAANPSQLTGYQPGYPMQPPPPPYNRSGSAMVQPPPFYPRIAQRVGPPVNRLPPPVPSSPSPQGVGIKVVIKSEFQVANPVRLQPPANEVPRSLFQFDFEFERRLLAQLEGDGAGWSQETENLMHANDDDVAMASGVVEDPVVAKYVAMGMNKEAVAMAVATFGDVQNKVVDFCPSYLLLREMGFPSEDVAGVLAMYDNDREKAIAHFV